MYVTNTYHNTSSISNMIGHLNWRGLADRRTDARLVMLYKITLELIAIPKSDILIYHQLDFPGTYTLYHTFVLNRGGSKGRGAPGAPPKIGKNMIFLRKIVIFHTKYPNIFRASLRSARFFFQVRPP